MFIDIETERLLIRTITLDDIDWYVCETKKEYFSRYIDSRVQTMTTPSKFVKLMLVNLINGYYFGKHNVIRMVIQEKATGTKVGGLTLINDKGAMELAYWMTPEHQNKGYTVEAITGFISVYTEKYDTALSSITAEIQEVNEGSIKVAEKCGFKHVGDKEGTYCTNKIYRLEVSRH